MLWGQKGEDEKIDLKRSKIKARNKKQQGQLASLGGANLQ
jgi:hypothetical protein